MKRGQVGGKERARESAVFSPSPGTRHVSQKAFLRISASANMMWTVTKDSRWCQNQSPRSMAPIKPFLPSPSHPDHPAEPLPPLRQSLWSRDKLSSWCPARILGPPNSEHNKMVIVFCFLTSEVVYCREQITGTPGGLSKSSQTILMNKHVENHWSIQLNAIYPFEMNKEALCGGTWLAPSWCIWLLISALCIWDY